MPTSLQRIRHQALTGPNKIGPGYSRALGRTGLWDVGGGGPGEIRRRRGADRGLGAQLGRRELGLAGELGGGSRANDRIEENQVLSGSSPGVVAWQASHGRGQGAESAGFLPHRRLIANLTHGLGLGVAGAADRGGDRARQLGANRPGRAAEGGLPPFASASSASGVADGGPEIEENRAASPAKPASGPCSIERLGREFRQGLNGSGSAPNSQARQSGSGVRLSRARRMVRRSVDRAGVSGAGAIEHGLFRTLMERKAASFGARRAAVNRARQIPVEITP